VPPYGEHYLLYFKGFIGVTDQLSATGFARATVGGQPIDLFGRGASDTVKDLFRAQPIGATRLDVDGVPHVRLETFGTGLILDDLQHMRFYRAETMVPLKALESLRDGGLSSTPLATTELFEEDLDLASRRVVRSCLLAAPPPGAGGELSAAADRTSAFGDGDTLDLALRVELTTDPTVLAGAAGGSLCECFGPDGTEISCAAPAPTEPPEPCETVPPKECAGTPEYCAEVVLFDPPTGPGFDDVPLNGETRANPTRSYLRRDIQQLVQHVAARVQCASQTLGGGNFAPLILGDMSGPGGTTPRPVNGRAIHTPGTHEGGRELDVGYYQTAFFPNNFMRAICPHHDADGKDAHHCTAPPDALDARRTAYFLALLMEDPRVKCVGVDARVVQPIGEAQMQMLSEGIITLEQFDSTRLCYESSDTGRGWFRNHHTHMHISTR